MTPETPERYEKIERLFTEALEVDPAKRDEWLKLHCDDPDLRVEVNLMLLGDREAQTPLDRPLLRALAPDAWTEEDPAELVGQELGGYRLRKVLASGGMGTVFEAVRDYPQRTVAVKVVRRGLGSPSLLRRFDLEAALLARLQHPGIAQVLDAGIHVTSGTGEQMPWFAMELVPGARPITQYADEHELGTRARLELFLQVCEAVQHGHHKGVIHRDLKPSNLLVDEEGRPKVIDFGVARSTDADLALTTMHTDVGQIVGTLQYMSPEQCAGQSSELDARTDVYALGMVLYELLCGRLAYDISQAPLHVAVGMIQKAPPARPSTVDRRLAGDLETIVLKALEKECSRRYASVHELAEDVRRFLESRPIAARPPSAWYQLHKLMQRHRPMAAGISLGLLALVAGAALASWQALAAGDSARAAFAAEQEAQAQVAALEEVNEFLHDVLVGADPRKTDGRPISIEDALRRAVAELEEAGPWPPRVEAQLRYSVGFTLWGRGLPEEAVPHLERALALWTEIQGPGARGVLNTVRDLGAALNDSGRGADAESLLRGSRAHCERIFGENHELTIQADRSLVLVLWKLGKWEEAERTADRVLEWYRVRGKREDPVAINVLNDLALIYDSQGRAQSSLEMMGEVIELNRSAYGPSHPFVLKSLLSYGAMLNDHGRHEEAERLARDLVNRFEQALPDDIKVLKDAWGCLYFALQEQGRYVEAEPWVRRALEECRERLGATHPESISALANYGVFLQKWGKVEDADPLLRDALALAQEAERSELTGERPIYDLRANLGWNRVLIGDLLGAEEHLGLALDEARAALSYAHPAMLRIQSLWAELMERQGIWPEALLERTDVYEGALDSLGPQHVFTMECLHNLALCHQRAGQPEGALPFFKELVEADTSKSGPDHENTIRSRMFVANALHDLELFDEEERWLQLALESSERSGKVPPGISAEIRERLGRLARPGDAGARSRD